MSESKIFRELMTDKQRAEYDAQEANKKAFLQQIKTDFIHPSKTLWEGE
jgi:hypothetical protein